MVTAVGLPLAFITSNIHSASWTWEMYLKWDIVLLVGSNFNWVNNSKLILKKKDWNILCSRYLRNFLSTIFHHFYFKFWNTNFNLHASLKQLEPTNVQHNGKTPGLFIRWFSWITSHFCWQLSCPIRHTLWAQCVRYCSLGWTQLQPQLPYFTMMSNYIV